VFDHDQRFKLLLKEFFAEFLKLFFPGLAQRFDFSHIVWLDKEVFADPPKGERGYLDIVAQLPTRQPIPGQRAGEAESWLALIHIEIEHARSVQPLRSRMFQYYEQLRRRHGQPVLPIVLYLRVGLDGIGTDVYEEYIWEQRVLSFEYLYVGLPALDAETYLQGDNWLGLALSALMRASPERKAQLAVQGLQRLVKCPESPWRRFLLGDCLVAYSTLEETQQLELMNLLAHEEYREARFMTVTWYDQGLQQGLQLGLEGLRRTILSQLDARFGPLSEAARTRVASWPAERLEELGLALVKANSLQELGLGQ
jgi:hypothetical protein